MKHFLFEVVEEGHCNEGEDFIVGAESYAEAREIAEDNFGSGSCRCLCTMTDEEAEASGLDEY